MNRVRFWKWLWGKSGRVWVCLHPPHDDHPYRSGVTNADGRVETLLPLSHVLEKGVYRITFDTAGYFRSIGSKSFYPEVTGRNIHGGVTAPQLGFLRPCLCDAMRCDRPVARVQPPPHPRHRSPSSLRWSAPSSTTMCPSSSTHTAIPPTAEAEAHDWGRWSAGRSVQWTGQAASHAFWHVGSWNRSDGDCLEDEVDRSKATTRNEWAMIVTRWLPLLLLFATGRQAFRPRPDARPFIPSTVPSALHWPMVRDP